MTPFSISSRSVSSGAKFYFITLKISNRTVVNRKSPGIWLAQSKKYIKK